MSSELNPIATIIFDDGARVVVELYPDIAENTVNSFIYAAQNGAFDNYKIARVEPGFVVDVSTNAFNKEICRYLIRNEAADTPRIRRLKPELGVIAMGGYDGDIAGTEFFFPLAHHDRLDGNYPCFGRITEGVEVIERIGKVPVKQFGYTAKEGMILHMPIRPVTIKSVRVETHGKVYPEPERLDKELPGHWLMENYDELVNQ